MMCNQIEVFGVKLLGIKCMECVAQFGRADVQPSCRRFNSYHALTLLFYMGVLFVLTINLVDLLMILGCVLLVFVIVFFAHLISTVKSFKKVIDENAGEIHKIMTDASSMTGSTNTTYTKVMDKISNLLGGGGKSKLSSLKDLKDLTKSVSKKDNVETDKSSTVETK